MRIKHCDLFWDVDDEVNVSPNTVIYFYLKLH